MHYSTALFSILAASGAMARTTGCPAQGDVGVTVVLRGEGGEGAEEEIRFGREPTRRPASKGPRVSGPFTEVELIVGAGVQKQDLRCTVYDDQDAPITVLRGENTDETFADGDGGPWTFRAATTVTKVTCDPNFAKISPDDPRLQVRVVLQRQASEDGVSFSLSGVLPSETDVASQVEFDQVTLDLTDGTLVDPALRCALVDASGDGILKVNRGGNDEDSFADGLEAAQAAGNAAFVREWDVVEPQPLSRIVCNPAFKKGEAVVLVPVDQSAV